MLRTQLNRTSHRLASRLATAEGTWILDDKYAALSALMALVLFIYMTVPEMTFSATRTEDLLNPNPFYRLLKFSLLALGTTLVLMRFSLASLTVRYVNRFYLAFLGLVALSITWSIEPSYTIVRLAALLTVSVICCAFAVISWHPRRFQNVLRPILTLLLTASLLYCIIVPDLAKETGTGISLEGAWHGLFPQGNSFGEAAGIEIILWVHAWFAREVKWWQGVVGVGIGATCLLMSRSSTSLFAAVFVVWFLWLTVRSSAGTPIHKRRYIPYAVMLLVLVIIVYSVAILNLVPGLDFLFAPVTSITGKDLTFSGRTGIWDLLREHIARRPMLGSGYGAYWIGAIPSSESYVMLSKLYMYPTEGHNGYLDTINDLGYVGLVCLLGYVLAYLRQALRLLKIDHAQAILFLALLFQQLIANLTESAWLMSSNFEYVIMTLAVFTMARTMVEQRLRALNTESAAVPPGRPPDITRNRRVRAL